MFYIGSCPDQTTDVAEGLARFVLAFFLCLQRGGEPKIGALYTTNLNHRTMMWYNPFVFKHGASCWYFARWVENMVTFPKSAGGTDCSIKFVRSASP